MTLFLTMTLCVIILLGFMTTANGIMNPYCSQEEFPILKLSNLDLNLAYSTDFNYYYDYRSEQSQWNASLELIVQHYDSFDSVWKIERDDDNDYFNPFINIRNEANVISSIFERSGMNRTTLKLFGEVRSGEAFKGELQTTSGLYDASISMTYKVQDQSFDRLLDAQIVDASPKEIILEEGDDYTLILSTSWGHLFDSKNHSVTFRKDSAGVEEELKFLSSFKTLSDEEYNTESVNVEGPEVNGTERETLEMKIRNFNHEQHSGYYCLTTEASLYLSSWYESYYHYYDMLQSNELAVQTRSCTLIRGKKRGIRKSLSFETCSWDPNTPLTNKAGLVADGADCLVCTAVGFRDVLVVRETNDNKWKLVPTELLPSNMVTVQRSMIYIQHNSTDDCDEVQGKYVCIAMDESEVLKRELTLRVQTISISTDYSTSQINGRVIGGDTYSFRRRRVSDTAYTISCRAYPRRYYGYHGTSGISVSLWYEAGKDGPLIEVTNGTYPLFQAETELSSSGGRVAELKGKIIIPYSSGSTPEGTFFCRAMTEWLTQYKRLFCF